MSASKSSDQSGQNSDARKGSSISQHQKQDVCPARTNRHPHPMSEIAAKMISSRQIAREVIAGKRNPWAAANHLEIAIWNWVPETAELELIFSVNDEVDWNSNQKRTLPELKAALTKAFAQLASVPIKT